MKKNTFITILVVIIVLVSALLLWPRSTEVTPTESFENAATQEESEQRGYGTLLSLSENDTPLECTIQYQAEAGTEEIEGSYFVDRDLVRGDFVQNDPALGQIVSSFIMDGEQVYLWSLIGGETFGIESTVEASAETVDFPVPKNESVRYVCKEWTQYDASIFTPPTDVLFRDVSDIQPEFGTIYEE